MNLNIGNFFSAARTATANTASNVYGFSKDMLGKGYSVCSSLLDKVGQVAGRCIPNAVSNIVKAHPKSFSFVAGVATTVASGAVIYRVFFKQTPPPPTSRTETV
jgi:hypothetical protein